MIPQIYITALITLIISLAFWGWLIYLFTGHQKRYFWLPAPVLRTAIGLRHLRPLPELELKSKLEAVN